MAENTNTAERELLKAIEGDGVQITKNTPPLYVLKDRIASFASVLLSSISSNKVSYKLTIQNANSVLLWLIIICSFWWFIVLGSGIARFRHVPALDKSDLKPLIAPLRIVNSELREYAYYLDIILSRNIFSPLKQASKQAEPAEGADFAVSNLKMVGISWAEDRLKRYAMIEDAQSKITYYVQEGDALLEFIVKEIREKQIILSYKGSEVRLQ
jgi:type II secretory pathway component PulC